MSRRTFISSLGERWRNMTAQLVNLPPVRGQIEAQHGALERRLEACTQELSEALNQQAATRDILNIISSSPSDVQPALDAIAVSAATLCDARNGGVFQFDGSLIHLVAHHNWSPDELEAVWRVFPIPPGRDSVTARAIQTRAVAHVLDIATDPEYGQGSLVQAGFHTVLSVPMLQNGNPIGAITVTRSEVNPFSEGQIRLLETFAAQAVITIENTRLFQELEARNRELTETLEQQTATSEVLKVMSRSAFDLQPVLDTLIENATRLCDAQRGQINRLDGDVYRLAAAFNVPPEFNAYLEQHPMRPGRDTVTGRAALERRTVQISDVLADPEYAYGEGQRLAGYRTILAVPMLRESIPIGVIVIWREQVQPFTARQVELVETFADQAVIAIENVRLIQELQVRTHDLARSVQEMTILAQVSQTVSASLDLQEVLTTIVTQAVQLSKTDGGLIYEFDEAEQVFVPQASYAVSTEFIEVLRQARLRVADTSIVGRASAHRTPEQIPDLLNEPNYPLRFVQQAGFRALLGVPLFREDRLVGALTVMRKTPGAFPKETVDLLQTFATQSTLAIQNARLFQEIDDKSRQLVVANQRLQELDQLKSDFLSTVSHELRTPLTSVLGFAHMIAKRYQESILPHLDQSQARVRRDAQRITENLGIIIDEGDRLTRLINEVLDLAKIESGKMEWKMQQVSLHDVVQRAVNATSSLAREKGLDVQVRSHTEVAQVYGDADRLTQVVTNLLGNAIKFTQQGSVTCVLERRADDVMVQVNDTGIGIAPADLDRVFEKFRQVGDTLTDKPKGSGLGLPICKEIIEHHGGHIWVESELGIGSTFIFTLPAMHAPSALVPEIPLLSQVKQHVADTLSQDVEVTPRILIVDDERHIRTLLRQELEGVGYDVLEAPDGHTALHMARTEHPHLIILDVLMPGLDGFQVTSLLKQDSDTAGIPILILSIVEDQERGYRLGVDSYLSKPIDSARLLSTVAELVARGHAKPTTRKKILVIEDDTGIVHTIEQVLSAYQVIAVQNGPEGIRRAQREQPDVIILDANLTDVGEVIKTLRSLTETQESQLLVLTEPLKAEIATILGTLHADESI